MDKLFWILGIGVALAGGLYGGYVFGGKRMKKEIEDKIGRTEDAMKKLVDEATNKAEAVKKEKVLEAKEEILTRKPKPKRNCAIAARKPSEPSAVFCSARKCLTRRWITWKSARTA